MKKLITLCLLASIMWSCNPKSEQNNETEADSTATASEVEAEEEVKLTGNFGDEISDDGAITADELYAKMESTDSMAVKVEGEILATCQMKGCWMTLDIPQQEAMRVTFKDYGFFVPKSGVEGKKAVVEGYAKKVTTDVETQKHYAKDAGKSQEEIDAITEPKTEIAFVANGVIIKDSK
ncbi:DUF4920 domain-containing protein [Fulvivirga sediminis]|uniref:DUF4920 domain-containing protein n=1 Tax=Fulvivirga sediminis TaxID=2803949 RepID=A0A937F7G7_9BACT|nr:DUF4920 domain-containing protein [Fulvivirga sediminis]MBL3655398.1 DUF4920 domain-containing protein [Fulvivirga sediminis]